MGETRILLDAKYLRSGVDVEFIHPKRLIQGVALLSSFLLASCSNSLQYESVESSQSTSFSGPHAVDLAQAYRESNSDYFRTVIADGVVTDSEYSEAQNRAKRCLEALGFSEVEYFPNGGSQALNPKEISDAEAQEQKFQCEDSEGLVDTEMWYYVLRVNPDNVNWDEAIRDCLVKQEVLEPGTSVDEMNQWIREGKEASGVAQVESCLTDPLGKLGRR